MCIKCDTLGVTGFKYQKDKALFMQLLLLSWNSEYRHIVTQTGTISYFLVTCNDKAFKNSRE